MNIDLRESIFSLIGYCQSLKIGDVVTERYIANLDEHYIKNLEEAMKTMNTEERLLIIEKQLDDFQDFMRESGDIWKQIKPMFEQWKREKAARIRKGQVHLNLGE